MSTYFFYLLIRCNPIDEVTRKTRLQSRKDKNDSIDRRLLADRQDFKNFRDYDLKLTDPEFEVNLVYDFAY